MISEDTIAAIATPLGEGGLAVIRLSGPNAFAVAESIFRPARKGLRLSHAESHTIHYGHVVRGGRVVDEVMLAIMRGPKTFTGEDVIEISCHGGLLPAKLVLDAVLEAGARLAQPGEFSKRAFLNGRIDLVQAEAVVDVIQARTELALAAANEQLAGKLSQRINQLRDDLVRTLAHIEAHLDFPDEDIAPDTTDQLLRRLDSAVQFIDQLLATAPEGQILRRGIRAAIVGRPNAGKSSLLNQLLGRDRAIVSPVPGTTRDTIEETASIRGLPVVFIDTAGLREAYDEIEQAGIQRSHTALAQADLILHVFDLSQALTASDRHYLEQLRGRKRILVLNKSDLSAHCELPSGLESPVLTLSCLTGAGLEALKETMTQMVWGGQIRAEMLEVMINSRHQDALRRAREAIKRSRAALHEGASLELVAVDLRIGLDAVGEVVGKTTTEDLLDAIFSQFCIGK